MGPSKEVGEQIQNGPGPKISAKVVAPRSSEEGKNYVFLRDVIG
ncbi:hypothetical protein GBAR_LOCUS18066, partial [Geodia barretti]